MKKAFTTAELLIAMTIIGVIAVLVVPPLIRDYTAKVQTSAIKNFYTDLVSAIEKACSDNNVSELSETKYIISGNEAEFLDKYFWGQEKNTFNSSYKSLSGDEDDFDAGDNYITIKNGSSISMSCDGSSCTFYIDTNGTNSPNTGGLDMFKIIINGDNTVASKSAKYTSGVIKNIPCNESALGENCVYELINNDWDMNKY